VGVIAARGVWLVCVFFYFPNFFITCQTKGCKPQVWFSVATRGLVGFSAREKMFQRGRFLPWGEELSKLKDNTR
jgi:hypothetical protein